MGCNIFPLASVLLKTQLGKQNQLINLKDVIIHHHLRASCCFCTLALILVFEGRLVLSAEQLSLKISHLCTRLRSERAPQLAPFPSTSTAAVNRLKGIWGALSLLAADTRPDIIITLCSLVWKRVAVRHSLLWRLTAASSKAER